MESGRQVWVVQQETGEWIRVSLLLLVSHVQFFVTPWTAACQASLSITSSQSLLKLMSIKSVMPSNYLILCCPLLLLPLIFPSIRSFPMSQFFASGGQRIGVSASASVLPVSIQDWSPCSPRDSQESSPTPLMGTVYPRNVKLDLTLNFNWPTLSFDSGGPEEGIS